MDPYIGEIKLVAFDFAPEGWLPCDGRQLNISDSQYQALFSIVGTFYGGDGSQTFGLPNLNGRAPIGANTQQPMGARTGAPSVTLTPATLPAHSHAAEFNMTQAPAVKASIAVNSGPGTQKSPANAYLASTMNGQKAVNSYATTATAPATLGGITAAGTAGGTVTVTPQGALAPVPLSTLPPVMYLTYIICYVGLYPSRPS